MDIVVFFGCQVFLFAAIWNLDFFFLCFAYTSTFGVPFYNFYLSIIKLVFNGINLTQNTNSPGSVCLPKRIWVWLLYSKTWYHYDMVPDFCGSQFQLEKFQVPGLSSFFPLAFWSLCLCKIRLRTKFYGVFNSSISLHFYLQLQFRVVVNKYK